MKRSGIITKAVFMATACLVFSKSGGAEVSKKRRKRFRKYYEIFINNSKTFPGNSILLVECAKTLPIRKLIVNTLIREVILYLDEIVITYNFTDRTEHIKFSKEHVRKTEEQIATATLVGSSSPDRSCILEQRAPTKKHLQRQVLFCVTCSAAAERDVRLCRVTFACASDAFHA